MTVTLVAKNVSDYRRVLTLVTFRFLRQDYFGNQSGRPFKIEQIKKEVELERNKGMSQTQFRFDSIYYVSDMFMYR